MGIPRCASVLARPCANCVIFLAPSSAPGIKRKEINSDINAKEVATLIISFLEGALMMGRLERDREPLMTAQSHLELYLETHVRLGRHSPVPDRSTQSPHA